MQLNIPCNRFAFQVFGETVQQQSLQNIVLSPISAWLALYAMANGAKNKTLEEMLATLGLHDVDLMEVNLAVQSLLQSLSVNLIHEELPAPAPPPPAPPSGVYDASSIQSLIGRRPSEGKEPRLMVANGIWLNEHLTLNPVFKDAVETYFDAEIATVDFSHPDTVNKINQWVDAKTLGKISKLISHLEPLSSLLLANAIYFQANWLHKFKDYDTKPHDFTLLSSEKRSMPTMFRLWFWDYVETDEFQAVRLAYRKPYKSETNSEFSMCIFLPKMGGDFTKFQTHFDLETWYSVRQQFKMIEGTIGLPKFSFDFEQSLVNILNCLGMQDAFDVAKADFGNVVKQNLPLFISEVLHKVYIGVDEEGTTAAGASAIISYVAGGRESNPQFEMIMDRPFIFTIQDEATDTLLFIGSVLDPS